MSNKHYTLQEVLGLFNAYCPIEQDKEELKVVRKPIQTLEMRYLGKKFNEL